MLNAERASTLQYRRAHTTFKGYVRPESEDPMRFRVLALVMLLAAAAAVMWSLSSPVQAQGANQLRFRIISDQPMAVSTGGSVGVSPHARVWTIKDTEFNLCYIQFVVNGAPGGLVGPSTPCRE